MFHTHTKKYIYWLEWVRIRLLGLDKVHGWFGIFVIRDTLSLTIKYYMQ